MIGSGKYAQNTWCQWESGRVHPCYLIVTGPYTPVYRCLRYSLGLLNFTSNSSFWLIFVCLILYVVRQAFLWFLRHPGTLQDLQLFRRWAMPLGSSWRYLLALTCSVFSPGQAKEEETTNKEREQGSQSQRWAWERTLPSSALRQPVRRRWSQGESAWIAGFLGLYCYYGNSSWEAPLANVLWSQEEL